MIDFSQARKNMVDGQIHTSGVTDPQILNAFETVPRDSFVPEKFKTVAYTDENINLGQGRFLIEPIVHARLLQAAEPTSSDIVLDIGSASGYSSTILSGLVTTVIAVEHNKRQIDKATKLWDNLSACNIALHEGALENGAPDHAPYSLIIINGAISAVPDSLLQQLDTGGRLVTVIKEAQQTVGQATIFVKNEQGHVSSRILFDAGIPQLEAFTKTPEFQF